MRPGQAVGGGRGFALVVALLLMGLIGLVSLGMAGLAAIELRRSGQGGDAAVARANARVALMQAIGQLQRTLGPDQRVSANAAILPGTPAQPHWTGVWSTTRADGSPFLTRDDLDGGLRDARVGLEKPLRDSPLEWLVSGSGDPAKVPPGEVVRLGRDENQSAIEAPRVPLAGSGGRVTGHLAWWTGDLGVRANLATPDAWRPGAAALKDRPLGKWFRSMISQAADPAAIGSGAVLRDEDRSRLASAGTTALTGAGPGWASRHAFDLTVDSQGVLADVSRGGLKRDLTAFFATTGDVPAWKGLPGLAAADGIVGHLEGAPQGSFRHKLASPTFGLLRDWAGIACDFDRGRVAARNPEIDPAAGRQSAALALVNEKPVRLTRNTRAGLQPVLVEATQFIHLSTFATLRTNPPGFQLRQHLYPRVVLWNPYNVALEAGRMMVMIQGNGRQEMWTENEHYDSRGRPLAYRSISQWLSFEGGRSTSFNANGKAIMETEGYNDPYIGSYYYAIPATRFEPGECLVFSPARQMEYNCRTAYNEGTPYNLAANELSCAVVPDPARSFSISGTEINGGTDYRPLRYWYAPTPYWSQSGRSGVENQADDTRAVLKDASGVKTVAFEDFDRMPQIAVVSSSLQYGAGREPRIAWSSQQRMTMEFLDMVNPRPTMIPNVRTREGVRLRWFDEHPSNLVNSGRLKGTAFMEEALLANWNPRAAFVLRSPWENIGGELPKSGSGGGPWFFGAWTRDLYDQAVSWEEQVPVYTGGKCRGNPFGPPQEGEDRYVLFDVPRSGTGVVSLAQLQHVKLSELVWHPSYAIGNSLADPRLGKGGNRGLHRSAAMAQDSTARASGGFHPNQVGWSSDTQRSSARGEWAATARAILGEVPAGDNLVYDLSFEANLALWDRYFLSTGGADDKRAFATAPSKSPLPNGRMRLAPGGSSNDAAADLADFHRSASRLMVDGAFNIHSTRVEAWKALLLSTRTSNEPPSGNATFARIVQPPGDPWVTGDSATGDSVWAGSRRLTPQEIDRLAKAIVDEVKARAPFISLADFVNRRLAEDETGRMGVIEAAIHKSGLNAPLATAYPLDNASALPDYRHPDNIADATQMEQTLKPASKAWGAPGWLTQADVLQVIGPVLAPRSDTFVIRAFGDAVDASGKTTARAWCEAVVQRTPEPLAPDESGINPRQPGTSGDFGRRFIVRSFRWLGPGEV